MEDPTSNIEEFSLAVSSDPNLTNSVLKLVNTEFFGLTGKIDSISRAVGLLGTGQLFAMVLDAFELGTFGMAENKSYMELNCLYFRQTALI